MESCSLSNGDCSKWNSEKKRVSSRTAAGPRRAPRTQVASRADTVEISRTSSAASARRRPEAVSSSSSSAIRAEVSITNQITLRAIPEYLVRGADIQQGQRRDAMGKLPHPLYFVVGPAPGIPTAEFGADGVEYSGSNGRVLELRQTRGGLIDLRILNVEGDGLLVPGHLLYLCILFYHYRLWDRACPAPTRSTHSLPQTAPVRRCCAGSAFP